MILLLIIQVSKICYDEEKEGSKRDPNKDLELHRAVCMELRRTMVHMRDLKADQSVSWFLCSVKFLSVAFIRLRL